MVYAEETTRRVPTSPCSPFNSMRPLPPHQLPTSPWLRSPSACMGVDVDVQRVGVVHVTARF
ncbi:hypothetical protein SCLCIDRAFT_1222768 [Scleroderma citrinum Foug A]|uniref:Uncharacterized protein n=1 Tax=Scleroderma citrinum Foug A TaxID=1036808 RepID=A0A0C3DBG0_9AGAM|nr:hypothetical protein SCLCIDRAFT_1222768 [Scleroderma citrinum Foug A]